MKTITTGIMLLILSCTSISVYAQSELYGNWNVSCLMERFADGSIQTCNLCPTSMRDGKSLVMTDFEMTIEKDLLTINRKGNISKVDYQWDSKVDGISFTFENTTYTFKVLRGTVAKTYVLKASNGSMLMLTGK